MVNQKATSSLYSASCGGDSGAKANYFSQLKSVLAQNKRYPRTSRRRNNKEGVVTLSYVAHADSSVLAIIEKSIPLPKFTEIMSDKGHKNHDSHIIYIE